MATTLSTLDGRPAGPGPSTLTLELVAPKTGATAWLFRRLIGQGLVLVPAFAATADPDALAWIRVALTLFVFCACQGVAETFGEQSSRVQGPARARPILVTGTAVLALVFSVFLVPGVGSLALTALALTVLAGRPSAASPLATILIGAAVGGLQVDAGAVAMGVAPSPTIILLAVTIGAAVAGLGLLHRTNRTWHVLSRDRAGLVARRSAEVATSALILLAAALVIALIVGNDPGLAAGWSIDASASALMPLLIAWRIWHVSLYDGRPLLLWAFPYLERWTSLYAIIWLGTLVL
ncbi:MAG: hypothetical protein ACFB6S_01950 [Geminicoccaceae bacterium]